MKQTLETGTVEDQYGLSSQIRTALENTSSSSEKLEALEIIGDLYLDSGQKDYALRSLDEAVRVAGDISDNQSAVEGLKRLAGKLRAMGSRVAAQKAIRKALRQVDETTPRHQIAELYIDLGLLEAELDQPNAARGAYESSIQLLTEQDIGLLLHTRINLLKVVSRLPSHSDVIEIVERIEKDLPRVSTATRLSYLTDIGAALIRVSSPRAETLELAEKYLTRGLTQSRALKDKFQESIALGYLGRRWEVEEDFELAIRFTRAAVLKAYAINEPGILYRWQWQLGRLFLLTGDRNKALRSYRNAVVTMLEVRSDLLQGSYVYFKENVTPLFDQTLKLLVEQAETTRDSVSRQELLVEVVQMIEEFNASEVLEYFDDDCLLPAQNMASSDIATDTAIVYPLVQDNELVLLVRLSSAMKTYTVEVSKVELDSYVHEFRRNLESIDDEYLDSSMRLYAWLLAPFMKDLHDNNVKTIVFVPSGSLRTIPFSALFDGSQYLVEHFSVVTSLGLQLTVDALPSIKGGSALLAGISDSVQGFSGLPGVAKEIEAINESFGGQILLNDAFSLETISKEMAAGSYSVIHLATHGYFDQDPQRSFLLTYDDRLTLDRLQDTVGKRRFTNNPLELLVLSACETATGDERAALGLAGVSLKAGAHTTLATLWPISDVATSQLMIEFYKNLNEGLTKSDALRLAQQRLMADRQFNHPFFWSPFLLIGNWL